jgi:anti-anti-sigma factor
MGNMDTKKINSINHILASQEGVNPSSLVLGKAYAGDRCMMALIGELRYYSAESLFEEVVRIFESGVKDLILDFRKVDYADTAGLQNLVRIYKYVDGKADLKFSILAQDGDIMNILRTCRFDKFIHITKDETEFRDNWKKS